MKQVGYSSALRDVCVSENTGCCCVNPGLLLFFSTLECDLFYSVLLFSGLQNVWWIHPQHLTQPDMTFLEHYNQLAFSCSSSINVPFRLNNSTQIIFCAPLNMLQKAITLIMICFSPVSVAKCCFLSFHFLRSVGCHIASTHASVFLFLSNV